jgi:cytochrome c556
MAAGIVIGIAAAAADVPPIVAERQGVMKGFGDKVKLIKAFADGEENGPAALEAAKSILETAPRVPSLFPAGTGLADLPGIKTHAKPEIWTDNERFRATAARLADASKVLAGAIRSGDRAAAAQDLAAMPAAPATRRSARRSTSLLIVVSRQVRRPLPEPRRRSEAGDRLPSSRV